MELIKVELNKNIIIPNNIVACIGEFDGVHVAHQKLIDEVIIIGNKKRLKKAFITFDPHPDVVLKKSTIEKYITPSEEKIKFIQNNYDFDYYIIINFTEELSQLSYIDFYNMFLKSINTIIVGYDFRFGFKGTGTAEVLKQIHSNVIIINQISYDNNKVGTQNIINCLLNGDVSTAYQLLGRFYKIVGKVKRGSQIGRTINYPTANIEISDKYCLVKKGVYAVRVKYNNLFYLGIANFGVNPSFNEISIPRLEVHIFNFDLDIYDEELEVEFIEFIRGEVVFPSKDDFKIQLSKDCNYCISKYGGKYETINCRSNG